MSWEIVFWITLTIAVWNGYMWLVYWYNQRTIKEEVFREIENISTRYCYMNPKFDKNRKQNYYQFRISEIAYSKLKDRLLFAKSNEGVKK